MSSARFEGIRHLPVFTGISDASFSALTRGAYVQNFPAHMEMITEGGPADFMHIVASGRVELYSTWDGRETSVAFLKTYDTFILAATIKDRPYLMSARTIEKSRIILIPSEDVRAVFERDSDFAKAIVVELAICYRSAIKQMKNIKLRSSAERLANYVAKHNMRAGNSGSFELPVEKRKLASFLGMTPENLSRAFSALKNHGVEVSGSLILIKDMDKLTAYAKPHSLIDR